VHAHDEALAKLRETLGALLAPSGCPWDRAQTVESLAPYVVEEAWELLDAVRNDGNDAAAEELGDTLMVAMLLGLVAENAGRFSLGDAARTVTAKLIRRHPHVFGETTVSSSDEVKQNWEAIKRTEGKQPLADGLPALPPGLPALMLALKLGKAAAKLGFDWRDRAGPMAKVYEEWAELRDAIAADDEKGTAHEIGDLLFAVVNLCRFTATDPEEALRAACARFRRRFGKVAAAGVLGPDKDLGPMQRAWDQAKEGETQ
jgi:tetrapyrrole methylase family protein / MazG family protein